MRAHTVGRFDSAQMAGNESDALARRLPQHAATIRRLQGRDPNFRAICDDYGEALHALAYWQRAASSSPQKVREYRQVMAELEAEALAILEAFDHNQGVGR